MSDEKLEQPNVTPEVLPAEEEKESRSEQTKSGIKRMSKERKQAKIIELAAQEVPLSDIARIVGMPKSTVKLAIDRFKPVFKRLSQVEHFREARADIISAAQLTVLEAAVSPAKIRKASLLATVTSAEKLFKMERLERNLSTDNINSNVFHKLDVDS